MKVEYSKKRRKSCKLRTYQRRRAQSIVEMVVGVIFLIPIVLFLFDVAVLVLCSSADDNLAKSACRAAASATNGAPTFVGTSGAASNAAQQICNNFARSNIIQLPGGGIGNTFLTGFNWNGTPGGGPDDNLVNGLAAGQVGVVTTMQVNLPVPFPGFNSFRFRARAVEPIVSLPPN